MKDTTRNNVLTIFTVVFIIATIYILGACASAPPVNKMVETEPEVDKVEPIDIAGDIDFSDPHFNSLWNTAPRNGEPVFFAAVPRMGDRDREYEAMLAQAAAHVSMFTVVDVTALFLVTTEGTRIGYIEAFDVRYNESLAENLIDQVEVLEYYRDRASSYMLVTVPGLSMVEVPINRAIKNGLPAWVSEIPHVPGYHAALGVARRRMFVADSITAADEAAIVSLARQTNIETTQQRLDVATTRTSRFREAVSERTEARLHGFYVVARYRSADGNYYYSLAVAKR